MSWFMRFARSTIGLKIAMAISGLMLFGFVIVHMMGNLQVFLGAHALDHYGEILQGEQEILWLARIGLLSLVLVHIVASVILVLRARSARPQGYRRRQTKAMTFAARTMRYSGPVILAFIVFHLLHLTVGLVQPGLQHCAVDAGGDLRCHVFANVVNAFSPQFWWLAATYIVAQLLLGMHLGHGAYSMFRTLGLSSPRYDRVARAFASAVAVIIVVGNCSIPLAVLTGLVHN